MLHRTIWLTFGLILSVLSVRPADADLIKAILLTQFIAFPAAIVFGRLGEWIGTRRSILIAIGCYIVITGWAASMKAAWEFYVLAAAVGLVQGGIQSLSRSMYSRLIPPEKAAEYFGLYNLLGKSAAVLGPLMMGWSNGRRRQGNLVQSTLGILRHCQGDENRARGMAARQGQCRGDY